MVEPHLKFVAAWNMGFDAAHRRLAPSFTGDWEAFDAYHRGYDAAVRLMDYRAERPAPKMEQLELPLVMPDE